MNTTVLLLLIMGVYMPLPTNTADVTLENFDQLWALGEPAIIEKEFYKLLEQAQTLPDKSIYLQLLSQIALTQALQKKFAEAQATLLQAEVGILPEYTLAYARILLEHGRVLQQQEMLQQIPDYTKALEYFKQSYELSLKNNLDYHTINAAHMIAIVSDDVTEKIQWNQHAIDLTEKTVDTQAQAWLGSLYNNLGQNYIEAHQYEKALDTFQKTLAYRQQEKYAPNIRVAQWNIARTLRLLGQFNEALTIQHHLIQEYNIISHQQAYDMPLEMFNLTRGLVYEELAELYSAQTKIYAQHAYDDLNNNEMFKRMEPKRLERLQQLKK